MKFEQIKQELLRKIFHVNLLILPILFLAVPKTLFLKLLIPISAMIVALDFLRRLSPSLNQFFVKIFGRIMRSREIEGSNLSGLSWTFLAACLVFSLCKPAIAVSAFFILAISDASASIIGKTRQSMPFYEKSLAGSFAFFITAIPIVLICGIAFGCSFSFFLFGFFVVAVTTVIEARPSFLQIDDNFSIPASFSFFMSLFDLMWHF